jgi:hypothetical protein
VKAQARRRIAHARQRDGAALVAHERQRAGRTQLTTRGHVTGDHPPADRGEHRQIQEPLDGRDRQRDPLLGVQRLAVRAHHPAEGAFLLRQVGGHTRASRANTSSSD